MAAEIAAFAVLLLGTPAALRSPLRLWALALLALSLAALLGGLDHAFFETEATAGSVTTMTLPTWATLGVMTCFILLAAAGQFFSGKTLTILRWVALLQLTLFLAALGWMQSFNVVIVNYLPVITLMLVCSAVGIPGGRGSWQMVAGIAIMLAGSAVQAAGIDVLAPLDRNGLYHLFAMAAAPFLYFAGLRLNRDW